MARGRGREIVVDSTLTIYNMTLNDTGTYHCSATTHDKIRNSTFVRVQVYSKCFCHITGRIVGWSVISCTENSSRIKMCSSVKWFTIIFISQ